jgi:hypothetical protein
MSADATNRRTPRKDFPLVVLLIVLLPILVTVVAIYLLYTSFLYCAVFLFWLPRGKDLLFVYSDSPHWKDYIETRILPSIQKRAVVLHWSERSTWNNWSLAAACFRHFGTHREFNPMAVAFRPFRRAKVFRFWKPFRDYKHGRPTALEETEKALFHYLAYK